MSDEHAGSDAVGPPHRARPHRHGDEPDVRAAALADLLLERGIVDEDILRGAPSLAESAWGPMNGARVVARAWTDPAFRERLLDDGAAACAELGFQGPEGGRIVVVENTATLHNVIVCTLCSCYPWPILGLPPEWYKAPAYRARVVREPRAVLRDFGVELDPAVEIQVWDSTAETRYMVLPRRPAGSDELDEAGLAALVTRDSMIGTGLPLTPAPG